MPHAPMQAIPHNIDQFTCTEEWSEAVGGLDHIGDDSPLWEELAQLQEKLWRRHFDLLTTEDKALIESKQHPSQSWKLKDKAGAVVEDLRNQLKGVDFVDNVGLGYHHGDTLVLMVVLNRHVPWRQMRKHVPEFFRGFMVKTSVE